MRERQRWWQMCCRLRIPEEEKGSVIMVGDRKHDVEGAAAHGIRTIAVTFGYGSVEELTRRRLEACPYNGRAGRPFFWRRRDEKTFGISRIFSGIIIPPVIYVILQRIAGYVVVFGMTLMSFGAMTGILRGRSFSVNLTGMRWAFGYGAGSGEHPAFPVHEKPGTNCSTRRIIAMSRWPGGGMCMCRRWDFMASGHQPAHQSSEH